jgi:hypothetical protein
MGLHVNCEIKQKNEPSNTKLNDSYKEYACPNGNLKPNLIHGNHVMYLCNSTMTYSVGIDSRQKEKKYMHHLNTQTNKQKQHDIPMFILQRCHYANRVD